MNKEETKKKKKKQKTKPTKKKIVSGYYNPLMEGGHIHCMKKKDNIIKFKPKKPKPMKYWLCEFLQKVW